MHRVTVSRACAHPAAEADTACGLITFALHAPILVTPQLSWGQDNAKSFAGTRTFPGHLGMGESDMCSLREIVGGEGGYRLAAKDIDRSLRISTDSKTPYSDATQVKYSINLDLRHILETN